mgnify:CR=1 FL=1
MPTTYVETSAGKKWEADLLERSGPYFIAHGTGLTQVTALDKEVEEEVDERVELSDADVVAIVEKSIKQRREAIAQFEKGGRQEIADKEKAEVAVIERFLPAQMSEAETTAAIEAIKVELGASGMKDMGRVMAELKARHASQLDMSKASGLVKAALS